MMVLYIEILSKVLAGQEMQVTFPNLTMSVEDMLQMKCYQALKRIKQIIQDETLTDGECFCQIEEIICLFEELGSNGGWRHDFG